MRVAVNNQRIIYIINRQRLVGLELQKRLEGIGFMVFRPISLIDTSVVMSKIVPDLVIADSEVRNMLNFAMVKKYFVKYKIPVICIEDHIGDMSEACKGFNIIEEISHPLDSAGIIKIINKYFRNLSGSAT
jgi:two-component SAPR family response regulator